jgi:hypothetical protein
MQLDPPELLLVLKATSAFVGATGAIVSAVPIIWLFSSKTTWNHP